MKSKLLPTKLQLRYFTVGVWNTLFGYFVGVYTYFIIYPYLGVLGVGVVSNIISITMSFSTYKWLVFRSPAPWWAEYIKCYLVYGATAMLSTLLLWVWIEWFKFDIWLSQAINIIAMFMLSYVAHSRFTFASNYRRPKIKSQKRILSVNKRKPVRRKRISGRKL